MKVLLDTSCLVSFFLMDEHYSKAKNILEKIIKGEIESLISALSLVELCGVIRRNVDEGVAKEVQNKMNELIEKNLIGVVPLKISDAYKASNLAIITMLKGADAIIVQASKEYNAELFTFDEEIKKKAKGQTEFFEV